MGVTGGVVEQEAAIALSNVAIWNQARNQKIKLHIQQIKTEKKLDYLNLITKR